MDKILCQYLIIIHSTINKEHNLQNKQIQSVQAVADSFFYMLHITNTVSKCLFRKINIPRIQ